MDAVPGLTTKSLGRPFLFLDEVDSTNTYCKRHSADLPHGATVLARRQYNGKGRSGKSWSPVEDDGRSLAFSLLLRDRIQIEDMTLLPLITGIGVCRGLSALCGCETAIKWSNDILIQDKKVCGVLCESRIVPGESLFAVLGMGVNLLQTQEEFDGLDLVYANSLFLATGNLFKPQQTAVSILNALESVWDTYKSRGFTALKAEYIRLCVTIGRQVRILYSGKETEALARDIADDGSLICTKENGETLVVNAGETSVRGLYGYI